MTNKTNRSLELQARYILAMEISDYRKNSTLKRLLEIKDMMRDAVSVQIFTQSDFDKWTRTLINRIL